MKSLKPPHLILLTIAIFVIGVVGWVVYVNKVVSYPLGDGLEYIGKQDYGCWLVCDANPASVYYYGTEMSVEEVVAYFPKASIIDDEEVRAGEAEAIPVTIILKGVNSNNPIYINYYKLGKDQSATFHLSTPRKQHLVSIQDEDYQAAKDSL
jgi:hypothetical protein